MTGRLGAVGEDGTVRPPRRYDEIIECVNDHDRRVLEERPDADGFVRSAVDDEFWPMTDDEVFGCDGVRLVHVVRGPPGVRFRFPFALPHPDDDGSAT